MPWLEIARDWPGAMAGWDAGRLARHAAHAARFVAAGWRADTADLLAFDLVVEEYEIEAVTMLKKKARINEGSTA
jgi:hypothetical protein